ncbi:MAG: 50S ribosome-binding GTPase [Phycisphaerae bacterium]|nr:50S ribosome-binding GTPase [Phycisphaerae bacterium]
MSRADTILAPATPADAHAPRALVRASGPRARDLVRRCFRSESDLPGARPAIFIPDSGPEFPVLLAVFHAPASYTGEDAFEVLTVGNPTLVGRVIGSLLGPRAPDGPGVVRLALPGEFTARAYENGRLTLDQAEGVAALIAARTARQAGLARRLLSGESGHAFRGWADRTAAALALVEASLDFSDQDGIAPDVLAAATDRITAVVTEIEARLRASAPRESRPGRTRIALVGAPNAGKSTLFNALLGRARAVASAVPGATRDALAEPLTLGPARAAVDVELIDLPGLVAPDPHAGPSIAAAQRQAHAALADCDIALWCDPTGLFHPAPPTAPETRVIRVRTMCDRPSRPATRTTTTDARAVCALDGRGLDALRLALVDAAAACDPDPGDLVPRHRDSLERAATALREAAAHAHHPHHPHHPGPSPELLAESLRCALGALDELTGRTTPDDILGRIFSSFCIGK